MKLLEYIKTKEHRSRQQMRGWMLRNEKLEEQDDGSTPSLVIARAVDF
jgi:hypothetical protein